MRAIVWCMLLVMPWLALAGCKESPQRAVLAEYERIEAAIAHRDARAIKDAISPASRAHIEEVLRLAREADEPTTRALPLSTLLPVLTLRNRVRLKALSAMDFDKYIEWRLHVGLFYVDAEHGLYPHKVTVNGDRATMQYEVEIETERTPRLSRRNLFALGQGRTRTERHPIDMYTFFERVGGRWLYDLATPDKAWENWLASEAAAEGMSPQDYLARLEEEEYGELSPTIWSAPK